MLIYSNHSGLASAYGKLNNRPKLLGLKISVLKSQAEPFGVTQSLVRCQKIVAGILPYVSLVGCSQATPFRNRVKIHRISLISREDWTARIPAPTANS